MFIVQLCNFFERAAALHFKTLALEGSPTDILAHVFCCKI